MTINNKTKVAVATDDFINVSAHAGRSKAYIIYEIIDAIMTDRVSIFNTFIPEYDVEDAKEECISNKSCHAKLITAIHGCKALICKSAGKTLTEETIKWGIELILTKEDNALQAAIKYSNGELKSNTGIMCTKL